MDHSEWNRDAMVQVECWLRKFINDNSIGSIFNIGIISRQSRLVAHILPKGNIDGFRHLLGKLEGEGCIFLFEKNKFKIVKKPE
jgi:hypothetical protein